MKMSTKKGAMPRKQELAEEICDWIGEEDDFQGWLDAIGFEDYINVEYLMAQFGVEPELAQEMLNILQDFLEEEASDD